MKFGVEGTIRSFKAQQVAIGPSAAPQQKLILRPVAEAERDG